MNFLLILEYLNGKFQNSFSLSNVTSNGHLDTGFSWFPCVYKQML